MKGYIALFGIRYEGLSTPAHPVEVYLTREAAEAVPMPDRWHDIREVVEVELPALVSQISHANDTIAGRFHREALRELSDPPASRSKPPPVEVIREGTGW